MMRTVFTLGVLSALASGQTLAQGALDTLSQTANEARVSLPWPDFKQVYEAKLRQELASEQNEKIAPIYSIHSAEYRLALGAEGAQGTLSLRGELIQGRPEPLLLFAPDLIIGQVVTLEGASLLSDAGGYRLHLAGPGLFQLDCEILVPLQEDARSPLVAFNIPPAVQNTLQLELTEDFRLLEAPGQSVQTGRYQFAPQERLSIRYVQESLTQVPVVDSFTRLEWRDGQYHARVFLIPRREVQQNVILVFPQARWLSASVQSSWIERSGTDGELLIKLPPGWQQPLSLEFALDGALTELSLPRIADNLGQEGLFQIHTPESAAFTLSAERLQQGLDPQNLSATLRDFAQISSAYSQLPEGQAMQITLERFATIAEPSIILDAVHQYASVAENGTVLTVFRLQVPPLPQQRLRVPAVDGAEVWSLTVNGEARSLYAQANNDWVIPLGAQETLVELAYWRKSPPLELQGRLELPAPALGLAAQAYHLAIGLPERIELVALEGDLQPGDGKTWPAVSTFNGRPYYFSQPFYRGDALSIAVHYREPLDISAQRSGS